jgi:hypothetical protein
MPGVEMGKINSRCILKMEEMTGYMFVEGRRG